MKLLVSACLLGENCRYDGGGFDFASIAPLLGNHTLVPVCPEQLGGLDTPRSPAELRGNSVWSREGEDVTDAFERGAKLTLLRARTEGCRCALLKERSPSCGTNTIYDGSFSGKRIPGEGVTAALLRKNGIMVFSEEQLDALLQWLDGGNRENQVLVE